MRQIIKNEGWKTLGEKVTDKGRILLFSQLPGGFRTMTDVGDWLSKNTNYDMFSFDVFDTLLRRKVDPPGVINYLVAKHISELLRKVVISISTEQIMIQQRRVENELSKQSILNRKEATYHFEDIISQTLKELGTGGVINVNEITNYAIDLEITAVELMPSVESTLKFLHNRNKKIIGVSETYLTAAQVARILETKNILTYFDKIYTSSDIGLSKTGGHLYQHILDKEGPRIIHIGDNYWLDVFEPGKLGMKSLWFHSPLESKRKKRIRKLKRNHKHLDYVNNLIFRQDESHAISYKLGYQIFGPALTLYVQAVIEQIKNQDFESLYFVARDGYILRKIFSILSESIYKDEIFPPSYYMCISRPITKLASLSDLDIDELLSTVLSSCQKNTTVSDAMGMYALEPNEHAATCQSIGLDPDSPILAANNATKITTLFHHPAFLSSLQTQSRSSKAMLFRYLKGINYFSNQKIAYIDIAGGGNTRKALELMYGKEAMPQTYGFYFDLQNRGINQEDNRLRGLVSEWNSESMIESKLYGTFAYLVELLTHPNHGITIGYEEVGPSRIRPKFKRTLMETQFALRLPIIRGILDYAREYADCYPLHYSNFEELLRQEKSTIKRWIAYPDKNYIPLLTNFIAAYDWEIENDSKIINPVSPGDIFKPQYLRSKLFTSIWPQANLRLVPIPGLIWLFNAFSLIGYLGK
jgi:FMN phosphatase YigB (HAD superfamily)